MKELRHPAPSRLYEVTVTTFQNRPLLRPSAEVNELIVGVLGRAQRKYGIEIHAPVFLSTHYHALLTAPDNLQLSRFMGFVNSNIAREVGRLIGWRDKFWSRRYRAIPVSEEEEAQVARLHYLLAHGVKEGLVARAEEWPGVNPWASLRGEGSMTGTWFDRTRAYEARRSCKSFDPREFAELETVVLTPLPSWRHLDAEARLRRLEQMSADIIAEGEALRRASGRAPLGVSAVLAQDPTERLVVVENSPAPAIHAASRAVRDAYWTIYRGFAEAFREAAEALKAGHRRVVFPPGSFPPHLPWVPLEAR
ncbi:MAG: transposase [Thermoanaerobaculia bacterium]|nr:transposase [Thermoanaerobaculia bacterium]